MSSTPAQGKRFFIDAVVSQALREGAPLSDNEQWMLGFSESDPDFTVDPPRMSAFEAETSDREYEAKIAGLIRRAYEHDVELDSDAATSYRDARDSLRQGDHYLLIMVDRALRTRLQPRALRFLVKSGVFLVLVPATAFAVLMSVALGHMVVSALLTRRNGEAWPAFLGFLLIAGISAYLVRIIVREARS